MQGKYKVTLTDEEREGLDRRVKSGRASARMLTRARILLKADAGEEDAVIAHALDVGLSTIHRVRQRFVEEGVEAAIVSRRPRRVYARALDGEQEAHLIAAGL
jgi:transposase